METMNQLRAVDIMTRLFDAIRDCKFCMDELRDDFAYRRRPCCYIRRVACVNIEQAKRAFDLFCRIAKRYDINESNSIVTDTVKVYSAAMEHSRFFGV